MVYSQIIFQALSVHFFFSTCSASPVQCGPGVTWEFVSNADSLAPAQTLGETGGGRWCPAIRPLTGLAGGRTCEGTSVIR